MHCCSAWANWAAEFLRLCATLHGSDGRLKSSTTLPHCCGVAGSGIAAAHWCPTGNWQWICCCTPPWCMVGVGCQTTLEHSHIARGHWGVELVRRIDSLSLGGGQFIPCLPAPVHGRNGQWNSCSALPDCLGKVGCGTTAALRHMHVRTAQWNIFGVSPHCLRALGSVSPVMLRDTA